MPKEIGLPWDAVLVVYKPLYRVLEAETHWYNTYHAHHTGLLGLKQLLYNLCLLYTYGNDNAFGIVGLQTDNTLFLANDKFAERKQDKLVYAAKSQKILAINHFFAFNNIILHWHDNGKLSITQEWQCAKIECVKTKNKYVKQHARKTYIATMC